MDKFARVVKKRRTADEIENEEASSSCSSGAASTSSADTGTSNKKPKTDRSSEPGSDSSVPSYQLLHN